MMFHMNKIKCPMQKNHFVCRPCEQPVGGHFSTEEGVLTNFTQLHLIFVNNRFDHR